MKPLIAQDVASLYWLPQRFLSEGPWPMFDGMVTWPTRRRRRRRS